MSEQNKVNDDGSFNIFDLGSSGTMADPFAAPENPQPQLTVATPPAQPEQAAENQAQAEPEPKNAEPKPAQPAENAEQAPGNPLAAAAAKAEDKQAAVTAESLFAKAPVFEYGGATEDITDTSKTFEELRVEKSSDFPELEDGKRVSWTMEYGKIVKNVPTPNKTVIGKMKSEIENSKEFIEALKKAKDKNLVCKVKPKITAQSKGIASYKGIFPTLEEADASKKPICILPARDGHVYEIRSNEVGTFATRAENVRELSEISAGFTPALPPVPFHLFAQIIAFFRHFMRDGYEAEALVHVYWDKTERGYKIVVPMQNVSKAHISVIVPPDETLDEVRYIHVADIHSHNSMPAFFSQIDDRDELATRVYIVVGRLDKPVPDIRARISNGGRFLPIDTGLVMETIPPDITADFPSEWIAAVNVNATRNCEISRASCKLPEQVWDRLLRRIGGWPA